MSGVTKGYLKAISLFSSAGIGDLAFQKLPVEILLSCELIKDRHQIYRYNFPSTFQVTGDIWQKQQFIVEQTKELLNGEQLDILFATPPCQGMSKNGRGKLLRGIREGRKPALDLRNRLIIPTLEIARSLQPRLFVLENVVEMESTVIEDSYGRLVPILELISTMLGDEYAGKGEVVEFADYGIPQRRQRLITVFSREPQFRDRLGVRGSLLPARTHSATGSVNLQRWVTVRDVISNTPALDAKDAISARGEHPLHFVPVLDADKYFWISNTPPEKQAFDNQCVSCEFPDNPGHSASHDENGINRASRETPIRCLRCGELLPRPWVREGNEMRLMKGYTSAYKRMAWDCPASALTTNFAYACSDNKVHPSQNRVLSIYEALLLHTVTDYQYEFRRMDGRRVGAGLIYHVIGESIPPRGLEIIFRYLIDLLNGKPEEPTKSMENELPFLFESKPARAYQNS
jgi:DNA (cytosine-5)-methyltransferase 1